MNKKRFVLLTVAVLVAGIGVHFAYRFQLIPHKMYENADFGITPYVSPWDKDGDGIDDQSDFLAGVRAYLATSPKYKSEYYEGGYPPGEYGVCTDVVAFGLLAAGYDLRELVDSHIRAHPEQYPAAPRPDKNIDFRRVRNLLVWFRGNAEELTADPAQIDQWQGGDIVIFQGHIGVVSDKRNRRGVPFVLHHGSSLQIGYEQDVLDTRGDIVAHFRFRGDLLEAKEERP